MTTVPHIIECDRERDDLMAGVAWLDARLAELLRDPGADADEIARLRSELRTRRRRLDAVEVELDRLVGDLWVG
jgi:hypothetical protein